MKSILFITPDCSYTGAPLYLLNQLRYLKQHSNYNYIVLFRNRINEQVLIKEFEKVAFVCHWDDIIPFIPSKNTPFASLISKIVNKISLIRNLLFTVFFYTKLKDKHISLIFSNTITIEKKILQHFKYKTHAPICSIVHEGKKLLDYFNLDGTVDRNFSMCESLICVSEQLKRTLIEKYSITKTIHVVSGSVSLKESEQIQNISLASYGIPENAKIVMCSGWLSWHKGADFFIQLAIQIVEIRKDIHFCWLGNATSDETEKYTLKRFEYDIEKAGIHLNVHHIPSSPKPLEYMANADVFLMLSRDESFSLVTLEACSLKKPVLCFEHSGGPCEILDNDQELIVPYGNINILSRQLLKFLNDKEYADKTGLKLFEKIKTKYTIEQAGSKMLEIIHSII